MKIKLPQPSRGLILKYRLYSVDGIECSNCVSETEIIDAPDSTYLAICDLQSQNGTTLMSWGYDRIQWLEYRPEYHSPARLAPKPVVVEPEPEVEPEVDFTQSVAFVGEAEEVHLEETHEETWDR